MSRPVGIGVACRQSRKEGQNAFVGSNAPVCYLEKIHMSVAPSGVYTSRL